MIAFIDPTSSVLPYAYHEAKKNNDAVDLYCSNTDYNNQFLKCWKFGTVHSYNVSRTTGSNFFFRAINYLCLLFCIYKNHKKYKKLYFNFPNIFIFDFIFFYLLRKKIIFVAHNFVPHDSGLYIDLRVLLLAKISGSVMTVSSFSDMEFKKRYKKYINIDKVFFSQHPNLRIAPEVCRLPDKKVLNNPVITFWGNIKAYKGVEFFLDLKKYLSNSSLNYKIEIYGKWDKNMLPLKKQMEENNIFVDNRFLDQDEVFKILNEDRIFVLPYKNASQSGVLYTFLEYRAIFLTTDEGDCGSFYKQHNLSEMLFYYDSPMSFISSLKFALNNQQDIIQKIYD